MDINAQLRASLIAQNLPTPSTAFLNTLNTRNPPPPLASLIASAKARILAADLTSTTIDASLPSLPSGIEDPHTEETKLSRNVHVQVVDVENLSLSRWEQIEELEAIEKGERTRGREVIRVTDEEGDETTSQQARNVASAAANAVHRLVMQDRTGKRVYAVELKRMPRVGVGKTNIGEKIMLKAGTVVARGTVLLTPESCVLLGGRVEAWHEKWTEERMKRLKDAVGSDRPT